MGAAAAPMLIGSAIGAVTSKNPLQGALLGGALGGAGGAFMSGAGGLSSMLPSLGSSATAVPAAAAVNPAAAAVNPATIFANPTSAIGGTTPAAAFNPAAIFANPTSAIGGTAIGGGPSTGLINASIAPTFMENVKSGFEGLSNYTKENSVLNQMAMQSAQQMMRQQEPKMAPAVPITRGQIQGADYMSLLNPQQSPVIRPQPISLLG